MSLLNSYAAERRKRSTFPCEGGFSLLVLRCLIMTCSAFAFAVKHYLREEEGLNHDDYIGVIPASFTRYDEGYSPNINSGTVSYSAIGESTKRNSQDGIREGQGSPDATKRVRAKRSKPGVSGSTTPLLETMHTRVDFNSSADHGSMPLPLVYVFMRSIFLLQTLKIICSIAHELSRAIFQFRREGLLETVGPAGNNLSVSSPSSC